MPECSVTSIELRAFQVANSSCGVLLPIAIAISSTASSEKRNTEKIIESFVPKLPVLKSIVQWCSLAFE
jgi:hypothetical protein